MQKQEEEMKPFTPAELRERILAMFKPMPAPVTGKLTYGCGCTYISRTTAYLQHECPKCWTERHEAFTNEGEIEP